MKFKNLCRLLVATIAACISGFLLVQCGGEKLVSHIVGVEEDFYLKYYYAWHNSRIHADSSSGNPYSNKKIVIYDISNLETRAEVANVLDFIYACDPKVIALDVLYRPNLEIKDTLNEKLVETVKRIQNKLVAPLRENLYPYFKNDKSVDSVVYARPVRHYYYDYIPISDSLFSWATVYKYIGNKSLDFPLKARVNYISKSFPCYNNMTDTTWLRRAMKDKVVIVGDLNTPSDYMMTPFIIAGVNEDNNRNAYNNDMPGTINIAYVLNSIISYIDQNNIDWTTVKKRYNNPLFDISLVVNLLISFFFCCLYLLLLNVLNKSKESLSAIRVRRLLGPVVLIVYETIVVFLCFILTLYAGRVPDLLLFMISVLFVELYNDLLLTINYFKK